MTQSRPVAAVGQRRHRLAVFIGRFSPPHLGHLAVIQQALLVADTVMIGIGSAFAARRFDILPFTSVERETMVRLMLTPEENSRVRFVHIEDQGNITNWSKLVRAAANAIEPDNKKITLIGHSKDRSSFYLKAFRGWSTVEVPNFNNISATPFRQMYFSTTFMPNQAQWVEAIDEEVRNWLFEFRRTAAFDYLLGEAIDVAATRKKYGTGPFLTGDAVIIHGDHVLMVKRGNYPFKDHWAFPGGFVESDEPMLDAIFRELTEETRIKVPEQILRQNLIRTELLDAPFRDPRARVISLAGLVYLNPTPPATMVDPKEIERYLALPRVSPRDDAKDAQWRPIADVRRHETAFDHFMVLQNLLNYIPQGD